MRRSKMRNNKILEIGIFTLFMLLMLIMSMEVSGEATACLGGLSV